MAVRNDQPREGLSSRAIAWLRETFAAKLHAHRWIDIKDPPAGTGGGMVVHGAGAPWHSPSLATASDLTTHTEAANPHSGSAATSALASYELLSNKDTSTSLGTSDTKYPSQNAVKSYVDTAVGGVSGGSGDARLINDGRIERASDTSLTWTGYAIGLYDVAAAAWVARIPSSTPSLANTALDLDGNALTYDAQYDIFAEATDGATDAVTLSAKKFTTGNTRAVTPALWQGRYCYDNTTDAGKRRLWLGTIRLRNDGGTAKFTDSETQRFVSNFYNRVSKFIWTYNNTTALWTYNSATFRESNNGTAQTRAEFVLASIQDLFWFLSIMNGNASNVEFRNWIGLDATTSPPNYVSMIYNGSSYYSPVAVTIPKTDVAVGYHYVTTLEAMGTGTGYFWGWQHCNAQTNILC